MHLSTISQNSRWILHIYDFNHLPLYRRLDIWMCFGNLFCESLAKFYLVFMIWTAQVYFPNIHELFCSFFNLLLCNFCCFFLFLFGKIVLFLKICIFFLQTTNFFRCFRLGSFRFFNQLVSCVSLTRTDCSSGQARRVPLAGFAHHHGHRSAMTQAPLSRNCLSRTPSASEETVLRRDVLPWSNGTSRQAFL